MSFKISTDIDGFTTIEVEKLSDFNRDYSHLKEIEIHFLRLHEECLEGVKEIDIIKFLSEDVYTPGLYKTKVFKFLVAIQDCLSEEGFVASFEKTKQTNP